MTASKFAVLSAGILFSLQDASYGAPFQNLNFESATLPPGQARGFIPTEQGIPGWTAYIGSTPQTSILFNNETLGSSGIGLMASPDAGSLIINGNFTLLLQAGFVSGGGSADVAITQSGFVPIGARSIQLKMRPVSVGPPGEFSVDLGGQRINLFPLSTSSDVTLFGGDITAAAGTTSELRLTAFADRISLKNLLFDSIVFSTEPVPEPGTWALIVLGSVLFAARAWRLMKGR